MGFFTDLFGSEAERAGLYAQYFGQAQSSLLTGQDEFEGYLREAMDFLLAERTENLGQYRQDYLAGIDALESAVASARTGMAGAFDAQRTLLEQGFGATKSELRDQFAATRGRQIGRNAFTGLGNTTFGDATVAAIDTEMAKQIGMVDERQRLAQAELEGQQAQIRNQFELSAGQSLFGARAGLAQGTLAGSQSFALPVANLLGQLGGQAANTYGAIASLQSGLGQSLAGNVGSGFNLGSIGIGAAGGAFSNLFEGLF